MIIFLLLFFFILFYRRSYIMSVCIPLSNGRHSRDLNTGGC
jgi:hypothetical protein